MVHEKLVECASAGLCIVSRVAKDDVTIAYTIFDVIYQLNRFGKPILESLQ